MKMRFISRTKQSAAESKPAASDSKEAHSQPAKQKFSHPKILLLDMDSECADILRETWSDVIEGSLGAPYKVKAASTYLPVIQHDELQGHEEVDVVILDLSITRIDDRPNGEPHRPEGERDLWAKCTHGLIDARVRTIWTKQHTFDRILQNGGVFVVFAAPKTRMDLISAVGESRTLEHQQRVDCNVWGITSELNRMDVVDTSGESIRVTDTSPIGIALAKHLEGARFECTMKNNYYMGGEWSAIAVNKFNHAVGMIGKYDKGLIIVVPQLAKKDLFLKELVTVALPEMVPHLFPEIEHASWTKRPEYELSRVTYFESEKTRIVADANEALAKLNADIESERKANGWLHDLLIETGDPLVSAVKEALAEFGFDHVTDVDKIRDSEGKSRREDLRIEDQSPMLVVDIKGIGGHPSDDDATQANKHALINTKELGRTDIRGLSIINHQRHLPPLERENVLPFRQELLDVASETELGLMTGFDVYRLVVNMRKNNWPSDLVRSVFYRHQRIEPIPAHYRYIGTVALVLTGKFGVQMTENAIAVGDRIAVEGPIYFDEAYVDSIHVNNVPTDSAKAGDPAGFLWPEGNFKLKVGMCVFAIPKMT